MSNHNNKNSLSAKRIVIIASIIGACIIGILKWVYIEVEPTSYLTFVSVLSLTLAIIIAALWKRRHKKEDNLSGNNNDKTTP